MEHKSDQAVELESEVILRVPLVLHALKYTNFVIKHLNKCMKLILNMIIFVLGRCCYFEGIN